MNEKNTVTILEAIAEGIRSMQTDIFLKDMEIERLRNRVAELEDKLGERKDDKN
jgi:hypothetical protein